GRLSSLGPRLASHRAPSPIDRPPTVATAAPGRACPGPIAVVLAQVAFGLRPTAAARPAVTEPGPDLVPPGPPDSLSPISPTPQSRLSDPSALLPSPIFRRPSGRPSRTRSSCPARPVAASSPNRGRPSPATSPPDRRPSPPAAASS